MRAPKRALYHHTLHYSPEVSNRGLDLFEIGEYECQWAASNFDAGNL